MLVSRPTTNNLPSSGGEVTISTSDLPVGVPIPKGSRLGAIEAEYGPLSDAVPCGRTNCGTPHKKGFVVTFADPQGRSGRSIIGHICGKKEFGQVWKEAKARHAAEVRKAQIQEQAAEFLRVAADAEPRLRVLLPGLEARNAIRKTLSIRAPRFIRACEEACRGDGYIYSYRDGAHVRLHRDGARVRLHQVEGRLFFLQNDALTSARLALRSIALMRETLDEGTASPKEIGERVGRLRDLRHTTETVEREAEDGRKALRPAHMQRLIKAVDARADNGQREVRLESSRILVQQLPDLTLGRPSWEVLGDLAKLLI